MVRLVTRRFWDHNVSIQLTIWPFKYVLSSSSLPLPCNLFFFDGFTIKVKCGVYFSEALIFVIAFLAAVFIRGRHQLEGGV